MSQLAPLVAGDNEEVLFASFEKLGDFSGLQHQFLDRLGALEPGNERQQQVGVLLSRLKSILDGYQEQAYLVDPHLDALVPPVVQSLRRYIIAADQHGSYQSEIRSLAELLYIYMNFRGYKTILQFFPHELGDLIPILNLIKQEGQATQDVQRWQLRYVVLLWLSLICMIPFDLSLFDEGDQQAATSMNLQLAGDAWLENAGLERFAAAQLLSRLYMRKDMACELSRFLQRTRSSLLDSVDSPRQLGYLQVLCQIAKACPTDLLQNVLQPMIDLARDLTKNVMLMRNTVGRQLRVKLLCRSVVRLLPAKPRARAFKGLSTEPTVNVYSREEEDYDVPEAVDAVIGELFDVLQDKATTVRWAAAKGVGRIAARLPTDFVEQTTQGLLSLFSIHSAAFATTYDLPEIAESTWHGACLASAELSRRGLIGQAMLPAFVDCMIKALFFDIRRGSNSTGSNVRDAAAYALWSTARIDDPSVLEPYALQLAQNLAIVAAFDREVQIRRAASAAYQEFAGRTNLFPSGIDVLRLADFFAVGIRRNSFLVVAPGIAEFTGYRSAFVDHLITVVLRHWDQHVRQLGASSLVKVIDLDSGALLHGAVHRIVALLNMPDVSDVHGGLFALSELAVSRAHHTKQLIFGHLVSVPSKSILTPRNHLLTEAACLLVSTALTRAEIDLGDKSAVPHWRRILDCGLRHRTESVQIAAALAIRTLSSLVDYFRSGPPSLQQSLGRFLGHVDYNAYPNAAPQAISCLLDSVDPASSKYMNNVEARRNCFISMASVVTNIGFDFDLRATHDMFQALMIGLTDYTTDERGDVGSWVRMACIQGLATFIQVVTEHTKSILELEQCLPLEAYQAAISGILKQGVERLDNVRQHAGEHFVRLLQLPTSKVENAQAWAVVRRSLLLELFASPDASDWNNSAWLYPRAVRLLDIPEYRSSVLDGLILSVASKTDSTQRPTSSSLVEYVLNLPVAIQDDAGYSVMLILDDLLRKAEKNPASNNVVIPIFQVLHVLMEGGALSHLTEEDDTVPCLQRALTLATWNVARIKNTQRLNLAMKIVIHTMIIPAMFKSSVGHLSSFLSHQYPKVRSYTAEYLYLVLSTNDMDRDTDEVEEILLETEWSVCDVPEATRAAGKIVEFLSADDQ